jgi:hypothetical protein
MARDIVMKGKLLQFLKLIYLQIGITNSKQDLKPKCRSQFGPKLTKCQIQIPDNPEKKTLVINVTHC